jgi:hypothetical protein
MGSKCSFKVRARVVKAIGLGLQGYRVRVGEG